MIKLILLMFNNSEKPKYSILRKFKYKCFKKENDEEFSFKIANETNKNTIFKNLNEKILKKLNLRFILPIL
jgi:hypothetical protein